MVLPIIYDATTGMEVAAYQLTPMSFPETFINDVIITVDAAYFTNSFQAEIYRLPLSRNGQLPSSEDVETIPLTGDFNLVEGFNANGIVARADGSKLIIAHSALGLLYLTDANTGETATIDL